MKHFLLTLCLCSAVCCFAEREVDAKNSDWLVGIARMNHSELTAEEVALKKCMAFVMYEYKALSETLPPKSAEKWANRKLRDSMKKNRFRHKSQNTHKYVAKTISEDEKKAVVEVVEYIRGNVNAKYHFCEKFRFNLEKKENGWIVVSHICLEVSKDMHVDPSELNKEFKYE